MKKIAIVLGLLLFSQAAFAGGTVLYMNNTGYGQMVDPYQQQQQQVLPTDPNANLYTADGIYSADGTYSSSQTTTVRKVKFGKGPNYNDSNVYWNFGGINFGSGFTSTGSSVKQY